MHQGVGNHSLYYGGRLMNLKMFEEKAKEVLEFHHIVKYQIDYLSGNPPILQVQIMKEDGSADLNDCVDVSHDLSLLLDEMDFGDEPYNLDVCSFGAEREISIDELASEVGHKIYVKYKQPKAGLDVVEGTLKEVNQQEVVIEYLVKGRKKTAAVELENIEVARQAVEL